LSTEDILKIKSLVRIGLLKELASIKGFGVRDEWMKESVDAYLVDCQLSKVKLAGIDLHKADLSGADLSGADLSGVNLSGANLSLGNLNGVDLNGADLNGAVLSKVSLMKANLRGANLRGTKLNLANLSGANLMWANLKWADLSGANLGGGLMQRAIQNLNNWMVVSQLLGNTGVFVKHNGTETGANLIMAKLSYTNLDGANLSGAFFHIKQASILEKMKIDISEVFLIEEDPEEVEKWLI
jgi:uncharacterized protein YjbI with pentapeptide repeats